MYELASFAAIGVFVVLIFVRVWCVRGALRDEPGRHQVDDVTVLIPIRSGDPLASDILSESVTTLAPARVLLLVDDDDPEGTRQAKIAAEGHDHVSVRSFGPPPPGRNPKVDKLATAWDTRLRQAPTNSLGRPSRLEGAAPMVAVVDDDTVVPPCGLGRLVGALADADLVTGVPVYREQGGLWSRLVAAFVNGSSLVTYLSMARFGDPVSVNGMIVLTRRDALEEIGGFEALATATCDDYALARAYRTRGLRIVQTAQPVEIATTVAGPVAYVRLLRRWMLFAQQVIRHDLSVRLIALVVLPAALPLLALLLGVAAGSLRACLALVVALVVSALVNRSLRRAARTSATGPLGVILEPIATLLAPLQMVAALFGSRHVIWRGRKIRVGIGEAQ